MRKLIAAAVPSVTMLALATLASVAGCHGTRATPSPTPAPVLSGNQVGAPDPTSAVRAFIDAAKQQDLQAMGAIFGDKDGAARDRLARTELEKREIVMACYLKHDSYEIVGDAPALDGARAMAVKLTFGPLTRTTNFQVVQGPGGRWFVRQFDPAPLQDLCAYRPTGRGNE